MKLSSLLTLGTFGVSTLLFGRKKPILGTIILTDRCNLHCKHCSVNNILATDYPYRAIRGEMEQLYAMGIRILFFCGGETFLWQDGARGLRELVVEAKAMGFLLVNVVTNGTFTLDLPEADLILLSLDGDPAAHNAIRGDTYDTILANVRCATAKNICLYMAINRLNHHTVKWVCQVAREEENIKAASFNFHTPYPDTRALLLTKEEKRNVCAQLTTLMEAGYPIFNLKSAFPYLIHNTFPTPCHQCVVMEGGKLSICGRCVEIPDLCKECGYFFAAEYALLFQGKLPVIFEMLSTYLRYI